MQRPNPGELLRGLRESLAKQVLPALSKGVPHQQMKAALHLIGRLEKCWDLAGKHLIVDNADIAAVLAELMPTDGPGSLEQRIATMDVPSPDGYNDSDLRKAAERNFALHQLLLDQPHSPAIVALHQRMIARDSILVGDREDQGNSRE